MLDVDRQKERFNVKEHTHAHISFRFSLWAHPLLPETRPSPYGGCCIRHSVSSVDSFASCHGSSVTTLFLSRAHPLPCSRRNSYLSAVTEKITNRPQDECPDDPRRNEEGYSTGRAKSDMGDARMDILKSEIACETNKLTRRRPH